MNTIRLTILAVLVLFSALSNAQTLRGIVRDAETSLPITGATVSVRASKSGGASNALATSPSGEFVFENLRADYYHCEITATGFETVYLAEILVVAGKEQVLEIDMRHATSDLPEVTIAAPISGRRPMQPMSEIPLTRDQTLRFPAMFFDPGRLAAAYPGVSQTDDGINGMSIRGNSPALVRWRMEGLDIVNPNHLPNAGTLSDAPASASGGVLMFSAQMLDNSSLLTGAFPAGYGDAVAGVMDMNLRSGNQRQHEFTAQVGLVGLDLAAEGPMKKGKDNSYLFNYRYSTVGLLGQLGVSFGDEQINFQDLSFNLHLNGKKRGKFTVFGMGGISSNVFSHKSDTADVKTYKDFFDIDFLSRTGVMGGTGRWKTGVNHWLKAAIVYSEQYNEWSKKLPEQFLYDTLFDHDYRVESRFAASVDWHLNVAHHQFSLGTQASRIYFTADILKLVSGGPFGTYYVAPYYNNLHYINLQPWARWDWTAPNGRWNTQVGAQFHYNSVNGALAAAPRGTATYRFNSKHRVSMNAGVYKQDAPVWMQLLHPRFTQFENRPKYISSLQAGIRYTWNPSLHWKISVEAFHQFTSNIPTNFTTKTSLVNAPEYISEFPLENQSDMQNDGVEIGVERALKDGWFLAANTSLFNSKYRLQHLDWLDSRWDIGHLSNVTFGKEWVREKTASLTRTVGVGLRTVWAGGPRESDINLGASVITRTTVLDETSGYFRRYPDYFRADFRVYWRRNLGDRRNSTFALDIQNITGRQNLAYHYYDPLARDVLNKFQLGTIPNFSWRVEF